MYKSICLLVSLFANSYVFTQSITNNPLSYYGIGEQSFGTNAIYNALGQNTISYYDSSQLNIFNPASYSSFSSGNTLFSLGIDFRRSQFSEFGNTNSQVAVMPDHFAMGFKLSKITGLAFGIKPYSSRGYEITEYDSLNSLTNKYLGTGGIRTFFLGTSIRVINRQKSKLAFGVNAESIFGSVTNSRTSKLFSTSSDYPSGISNSTIKVSAINVDFGISFNRNFSKRHNLMLSAVYTPNLLLQKLSLKDEIFYAKLLSGIITYDTISYFVSSASMVSSSSRAGFSYTLNLPNWQRNMRQLHPSIMLVGSYSSSSMTLQDSSITLLDSKIIRHFGFGIQFIPETKLFENSTNLKFLEKVQYRIGYFKQQNSISNVIDKSINISGITFGFGIPILVQQSLSSLNIGFTFGKNTDLISTSLAEKYFAMNFGIILSPPFFDRWFRKRKLD
jgi:hypothetical protein